MQTDLEGGGYFAKNPTSNRKSTVEHRPDQQQVVVGGGFRKKLVSQMTKTSAMANNEMQVNLLPKFNIVSPSMTENNKTNQAVRNSSRFQQ